MPSDPADPDEVLHHITVSDVERLHGMVLTETQAEEVKAALAAALTTAAPWLTLTEVDGVEVLGALDVAAKLYALTGDKHLAAHYRELYDRLCASAGVNRAV